MGIQFSDYLESPLPNKMSEEIRILLINPFPWDLRNLDLGTEASFVCARGIGFTDLEQLCSIFVFLL